MAEICVVHLVWAPLGPEPLERFAGSYRAHHAGTEHRLLMVFKQWGDAAQLEQAQESISDLDYAVLHMPRRRLDLAAYIEIARQSECPMLCFLNSSSELLADAWLEKLARALRDPAVGIVGATGSYESLLPRSGIRRAVAARWFCPFPNPHVRTNAFMIRREVMLSLDWRAARTKWGAWMLENGKRSVTRQIRERGLEALVVGADGQRYPVERWKESNTFRSGGQENLLVADNRTRQFAQTDPAEQERLAKLAWGPEED